ncbi:F-box domain, cyclin-like protein [Artemisia annua]|uniref:F-box domain, cyclin-like protein n=1 Tax=Artemisia annua TaxID=35608 RepID=A0A2U1P6A7_ARTAN|nr:F-box domain, cyclin-like protein [Artemisia annua]
MRKKLRGDNGPVFDHATTTNTDLFDTLPDDIVLIVLCKLSSTSSSPSDFISVLLTCKRLNKLGVNPLVLKKSCKKSLAVRAKNWCDEAHRYLKLCVKAGNTEAYYTLGMILFYCLQNRGSGASLMAKAAIRSHAPALYSLALIQFNGSGGMKNDKDLRAGVALCCRSAYLGHVDAIRELGHCLQDGYGVRKNVTEGRRLLMQANARELSNIFRLKDRHSLDYFELFESHPVNKFLAEWFGLSVNRLDEGLRMCGYKECGRPETRMNEFRKCSGCGKVNYCSRGCQAHDWRVCHKVECAPMEEWVGHAIDDVEGDEINGVDGVGDDRTVEIRDGEVDGMQI